MNKIKLSGSVSKTVIIGQRIKEARLKVGLTQQYVADALGTVPELICFLEAGATGFLVDYLVFLRNLGLDLNVIFSDEEP